MLKTLGTTLLIFLITASLGAAQPDDTTFIPPPADTTGEMPPVADSLKPADSLTDARQSLADFEKRLEQYEKRRADRKPNFSFFDSLVTYFTSERLNQRRSIERSFYHDAGDYFRFNPSFFVIDYQSTPMRKTVRPFGLSGNRLNVISNRISQSPFEHVIEPDGLIDFNDIATATDHDVWIIPGPTGMLFGGNQTIASLVTMSKRPDSYDSESALLVDQGAFAYNYVRGRYSKLFSAKREIDASIEYRNADGNGVYRNDDAYHYTGRLFQPLGLDHGLTISGQLYNREGLFVVQPDGFERLGAPVQTPIRRNRFDMSAEFSLDRHNADHTARSLIGMRSRKHTSHLDGPYKGRFDFDGWGTFVAREFLSGNIVFKAEGRVDHVDMTDGFDDFVRDEGEASLTLAKTGTGLRYALSAKSGYLDGFDLLPEAAAVLALDQPGVFFLISAGYAERAPTLYELNLKLQQASVYPGTGLEYADRGNSGLTKEKQLVASGMLELGSEANNIRFSVTGGTIVDGIDWIARDTADALGTPVRLFVPENTDIDFVDLSVQQKLKLKDFLTLRSGAAYHDIKYELIPNPVYTPDYQVFSGLELHYYWPQKIMHLFAYGEIVYTSEYDGYDVSGLGQELIANIKLSFQIKRFRFHYVMQNALSNVYDPRENFSNPGRYTFFGLSWGFLN